MKKMTRFLCLIAVFAMCLSLCGCGMLDDLRAKRATMTADGNIKLYDGTEYKLLPYNKLLSPKFYHYEEVYIVEEDLPLLLTSTSYENYVNKSDDGCFLKDYLDGNEIYYCRTDMYDSVLERMNNSKGLEVCYYIYYDSENYAELTYTLTQQQWDMVKQVLATQEPQMLRDVLQENYEYWVGLYMSTADGLFTTDRFALCIYKGKCYVIDYEKYLQYAVPAELTDDFKTIMAKEIEYTDSLEW
jgi:hypothetical protein